MKTGRPPRTYPFRGELWAVPDLAREAGCSRQTMRKRLLTLTPAAAVAMGCANPFRPKREPETKPPEFNPPPGARLIRSGFVHVAAPGVTRHLMGE